MAGAATAGAGAVAGAGLPPPSGATNGGFEERGGTTFVGSGGNAEGGTRNPVDGHCNVAEVTLTTQVDIDRYADCTALQAVYLSGSTSLLDINWPQLKSLTGSLHLAHALRLSRVLLPQLRTIFGELYVADNRTLVTLSVPALEKITGDPDLKSAIFVRDNPSLTKFDVSLDLRVSGIVNIGNNPRLCGATNLRQLFYVPDLDCPINPTGTGGEGGAPPDIGIAGAPPDIGIAGAPGNFEAAGFGGAF